MRATAEGGSGNGDFMVNINQLNTWCNIFRS